MAAHHVETLFDQLIGSNSTSVYEVHQRGIVEPASEDGTGISDIRAFLENIPGDGKHKHQKVWKVVVDCLAEWVAPGDFSLEAFGDAAKDGPQAAPADSIPGGLRPGKELAQGDSMQVVIEKNENGTYAVMKIFNLNEAISATAAHALCQQEALRVPRRANFYGARKAFQTILQRAKGWKLMFARVVDAAEAGDPGSRRRANSGGEWSPTTEEITRGMEFIQANAPPAGTMAQVEWLLIHNKARESPIRGWPAQHVNKICEVKAKSKMMAELEQDFPLTLFDLKDSILRDVVAPMAPYLPDHGLIAIGRPEAGKTPFAFLMASCIGQHWIDALCIEGAKPGWYRAKQFDDMRGVEGKIFNGVVVDDGNVPRFRYDDVKQFLDAGFKGHVDCRYAPISFVKNCFRAICDNTWDKDAEPPNPKHGDVLTWEEFLAMLRPSFSCVPEEDLLAILKRGVVIIAGYRAIYLRLPSSSKEAPILVVAEDEVGDNWFKSTNMSVYGALKRGVKEYPNGFKEAKIAEAELFANLLVPQPRGDGGASSARDYPVPAWDGSLPASSDRAPGWWALLQPEKQSALASFANQSIQHLRGLSASVFQDMRTEFGISYDVASDVVHYFLTGSSQAEALSKDLEAGLGEAFSGDAVAENEPEDARDDALQGGEAALDDLQLEDAFEDALRMDEAALDDLHGDAMDFLGSENPPPEKGMKYFAVPRIGGAWLEAAERLLRKEKNADLIADEAVGEAGRPPPPKRARIFAKRTA